MENQQIEKHFEKLVEVSREKQIKLEELLFLTNAQSKAIEEEGIENIEKLLNDKQKKIEEINKNDEEFYVYYEKIKEMYSIKNIKKP